MSTIQLHEPAFDKEDESLVLETLRTAWVSTGGPFVDKFEQDFAQFVGVKFAVSVCNGTIGLSLSLEILKRREHIQEPFEVIAPTLTFVATVNAIFHAGGSPVLVDSAKDSLNVDPKEVQNTVKRDYEYRPGKDKWYNKITKKPLLAVMPAHIMGYTCDMELLRSICEDFRIPIIEDAAEALGSFDHKSRHIGHHGLAAAFSFNGNKILTTGGGGMITTNDEQFAKRAKHLSTTAKTDNLRFVHDELGYNYRMVNILAALGCAQLPKMMARLERKREIFSIYKTGLIRSGIPVIEEPHNIPNHWIVNCRFPSFAARESRLQELIKEDIMCRPLWTPAHELPYIKKTIQPDYSYPNAEEMWRTVLSLPSSPQLVDADILNIVRIINNWNI